MNGNSSVGQSISKRKDEIISILLQWQATYDSCDFDLFRGMAENLKTHFSKKFNKFIDEASDRLKSQHQSSVCLVKKERAPNVEPKVNAFSSIGQLISKCDKDIQAILLEWETMYGSCDFELFRGMAESLNKHFGKIIDEFIEKASTRAKTKNKSPVCMVKNERAPVDIITIDSDDEPEITDNSSNQSIIIIDINTETGANQNGPERQPSTEINSVIPCQSSSNASRKKKKLIRFNFQCEVCLQKFTQTSKLVYHRRIHLNDGLVHCRICLCSLSTKTERAIHEKKCNKKRYECCLCRFNAYSYHNLLLHMCVHTGKKPFECDICGTRFTQKGAIFKHHRLKHNKNK